MPARGGRAERAGRGNDCYSFRHALLAEAVYDDLLPGERVRLHARVRRCARRGPRPGTAAELARHARLAMDHDTALDASIRAGDEAMSVGGPDEAAQHYQQALEMLADPRREPDPDFDLSKLVANAADALTSSGPPGARPPPARAPRPAARRRSGRLARALLAIRASALFVIEPDEDPRGSRRGRPPAAPGSKRTARQGARDPRPDPFQHGRYDEAQAPGLEALAVAEKLELHELASDAITT